MLACTSECHEGTTVVLPIGRKAQRQEVLRGTVARPAHTRTVDAATEVQRPHGGGLTPGGECAMERSAYEDCAGITQPRDGKIPCAPRFAGAASSNHHEHVDVYVLFHCMQIVQCCSSFRCNSSNMMKHHRSDVFAPLPHRRHRVDTRRCCPASTNCRNRQLARCYDLLTNLPGLCGGRTVLWGRCGVGHCDGTALRQTLRHVSMFDREGVCTLQVNPPAGPIVGYVSEKARQFRGCVVLVA